METVLLILLASILLSQTLILLSQRKTEKKLEELYRLADVEKKLEEKLKKLEKPTTTLQEFIEDIAHSGCGMIRIDPDAILIRGFRK